MVTRKENLPEASESSGTSSYRRIVKHSSVYMTGMIISRVISFVMLPLYTHYLSPDDYGILELLMTTSDIIAIVVGIGLSDAVFRFYSEARSLEEKNRVISTALYMGVTLFFVIFGLMFLNARFFSSLLFTSEDYTRHFQLVFFSFALTGAVELPFVYLRARAQSVKFVVLSTIRLITQLGLNILFIVVLGYKVLGVLYSTVIVSATMSLYLVVSTMRGCGFGFSRDLVRKFVSYGLPLVASGVGTFIVTTSDRFILKAFRDLDEVGLYSLGFKFGSMVILVLMGPFFQHWAIEMFEIAKRRDHEEVFARVSDGIFFLSIILIFGVSVYIKEIIMIIAAPEYLEAYTVVPIVCLAYYFSSLAYFVEAGVLIQKKTKYIAYSMIAAVVTSLGLNFLLIPSFGMYGAGVAVACTFSVRFLLIYRWSQKVYPLPYKWFRLNSILVYGALLLVGSFLIRTDGLVVGLIKDTAVVSIFLATVFFLGLKAGERALIIRAVKAARNPRQALKTLQG